LIRSQEVCDTSFSGSSKSGIVSREKSSGLRKGADIHELLGSFGIALFTTIVGVAGRVLFVQMRGDIDDVEDEVRRDLLSASADLRAQLNVTLAEFETFHTGVQQATRKAAEDSLGAAQDAISHISRVANTAADDIHRAFHDQSDRVDLLRQSTSKLEAKLTTLTADLNDRFDEFNARLDRAIELLAAAANIVTKQRHKWWFWPFGRS
jgi:methyl-accepting chemotaxis protein